MRRLNSFAYFWTVPRGARPLPITCFGGRRFMTGCVVSVPICVTSAERIADRLQETIS